MGKKVLACLQKTKKQDRNMYLFNFHMAVGSLAANYSSAAQLTVQLPQIPNLFHLVTLMELWRKGHSELVNGKKDNDSCHSIPHYRAGV